MVRVVIRSTDNKRYWEQAEDFAEAVPIPRVGEEFQCHDHSGEVWRVTRVRHNWVARGGGRDGHRPFEVHVFVQPEAPHAD